MNKTPFGFSYDDPLVLHGKGGAVTLPNRTFLAPMAGVSDLSFRILCHAHGAGLVAMEMVSAKALTYHNKNTTVLLETIPEERPVSLQLFGHEPEVMAEAARMVEELTRFDILDINMGCPVPKIYGNGDGSALMKDPALIEKIVAAVADATTKPLTVKIRIGLDDKSLNAVDCAKAAEAGGAAAVAVHGRTRVQMYSGEANREKIAEVVKAVKIPVFGNGDVRDGESAIRMFEETGCEAIMIGRAAQGNPWIFDEVRHYLRGEGVMERPSLIELKEVILKHASLMREHKSERTALMEMRKHVAWYVAGFPGASRIRQKVNMVETFEDLQELVEEHLR